MVDGVYSINPDRSEYCLLVTNFISNLNLNNDYRVVFVNRSTNSIVHALARTFVSNLLTIYKKDATFDTFHPLLKTIILLKISLSFFISLFYLFHKENSPPLIFPTRVFICTIKKKTNFLCHILQSN